MKYTAEEVRAMAKMVGDEFSPHAGSMLSAFAERIKADEDALPASLEQFREAIVFACVNGNADKWRRVLASFDSFAYRYKRSRTPPAQAAQVDQVGELLAIIHGDGGHYRAEHGLQKAAKDAQEKVIQMMTKIVTAEPVAQGESGVIRHVGDSRFESWFSEYVVGQNGAKQQARDAYGAGLAEQAERLAAQPAQSVDIKAIREVIESHINEAKNLRHDPESQDYLYEQADKLEAALQEKGNG